MSAARDPEDGEARDRARVMKGQRVHVSAHLCCTCWRDLSVVTSQRVSYEVTPMSTCVCLCVSPGQVTFTDALIDMWAWSQVSVYLQVQVDSNVCDVMFV